MSMVTRIQKTRTKMHENGIDNLIVINPFNLKYLADFDGLSGDGCMVINDDIAVLIIDARYEIEMNAKKLDEVNIVISSNYYAEAIKYIKPNSQNIGFEDSIPYGIIDKIR